MTEREPLENDSPSVLSPKTIDERESGVIQGAFGTIRLEDRTPRRTWRGRLLTLAAIIGPGIIVLVGDNDAGGVATYAQAGQNYGYSLLWLVLGGRPLPSQLPGHQHGIHRRDAGRRVLRIQPLPGRAAGDDRPHRDHDQRQLPALGAVDVRVPVRVAARAAARG